MTVLLFRHMGYGRPASLFFTSKSIVLRDNGLDWTGKSRNERSKSLCVQCYFVTLNNNDLVHDEDLVRNMHTKKHNVKIKIRHYRDCVFSVFDDIVYRTKTLASNNNKKHVFPKKLINRYYFRQEMTTTVSVRLA